MKKVGIAALLMTVIIIASCKKKDQFYNNECSTPAPLTIMPTLCTGDTCTTYLAIWKELFMERNNMSQSAFAERMVVYDTKVVNFSQGTIFRVRAKFTSGWAIADYDDDFYIRITTDNNNYTGTLPKNKLLTKNEIVQYLFETNNKYSFVKINFTGNLFYSNPDVVLKLLAQKSKINRFCNYNIGVNRSTGNLVLSVFANIFDKGTSVCISAQADLNMGDLASSESRGCVVD